MFYTGNCCGCEWSAVSGEKYLEFFQHILYSLNILKHSSILKFYMFYNSKIIHECEKDEIEQERRKFYLISKINGMCLLGMDGVHVLVEVDVSDGLPGYSMVGYLASEVKEAQDRVRTAIRNLNLSLLPKKVTINLSPADMRKEGSGFDLPIAIAILAAYGFFDGENVRDSLFIGELGLDGKIKGVPGILTLTAWAQKAGFKKIFLPEENLKEASVLSGVDLVGINNLKRIRSR